MILLQAIDVEANFDNARCAPNIWLAKSSLHRNHRQPQSEMLAATKYHWVNANAKSINSRQTQAWSG